MDGKSQSRSLQRAAVSTAIDMIYIADPLQISVSFHVHAPVRAPRTFWLSEKNEVFDHRRYFADGRMLDCADGYFWDSYETLQKKERKMFFRLLRCVEKNQPKGAACAARHVFRIARARERKESRAMREGL